MTQLWRNFGPLLAIGAVAALPLVALCFTLAWRRHGFARDRAVIVRAGIDGLLALWALSLVLVTQTTVAPGVASRPLQITPFKGLSSLITDSVSWEVPVAQIGGLVLLFLPLGILLALRFGWGVGRTVLAGTAIAVMAEALQWLLGAGRVASTDDVLVAAIGTLLGAALVAAWRAVRGSLPQGANVRDNTFADQKIQ